MSSPRKLTIVQADFHRHWGGQPEVVLALSQALNARGHRVLVACPAEKTTAGKIEESDLSSRSKQAGLETFTHCQFKKGLRPLSFLRDVKRLGAFLKRENVHIYHCHGSQDHWTGVAAIRRFELQTLVIRTRHNIYPIKNHAFNRWLFRRKTAQVITIFGEQQKFFTESELLRPEQLVTLHSPLPQEFVSPADTTRRVRNELKLENGTPLVGFVANLHPDKAPLDFVEAAAKISAAHPKAHFAIAGHGPLTEDIKAKVAELKLGNRLHLLGFRRDMVNVMSSFDLLMLTSITREASSTVLKQAGAMGVPAIATDVGGTDEVIEDGTTGIVVKPGDVNALASAALSLLNDRARATAMGAAGKKKVLGEFTAQAIAEKTEAIYWKALAHRDKNR